MRGSRKHLFSRLGGEEAMYAALALLTEEGLVMLEQDRGSGGQMRTEGTWLKDSLTWGSDRGWLKPGTESLEGLIQSAKQNQDIMRSL